ncbi:cytochrome-c oxidase, cbb3-type subunit III [Pseudotabrizicola sediminis]|uniref:Cbb3-type cytochrome c oxidase subunit n=1 Tax=Pseudotabrizicola sediminis TaxID=2486418 RepID=A0ABY2KQ38_9RHOB|nr:cytochrome-c oxidase, cbb3-type subunit III [Pseudotabrizicola sediminis]TGD44759.1 cytochrome-c oxidase, cbb3-type subunit III [Pseudotabrizicola sediminis]
MCAKKVTQKPEDVPTTGHIWDGIEELDNPMPRWWVWVFYATIVWGIGYSIAYPAWPMITKATPGLLGASTRADVVAEIKRFDDANATIKQALVDADLTTVSANPDLMSFAQNAGAAVFRTNCTTCHGSGANGIEGKGYPSLLDDDWLWGGDVENIYATIAHGIRNTTHPDARWSQMPAFGADEILERPQVAEVVEYVLQMSGQDHDATLAAAGEAVYLDNCAACHMEDGSGDVTQGAPNLADAIWLYGGSRDAVTYSVVNARFGVMPGWNDKLPEDEIRAVALYVHSRGGGQ